MLNKAMIIGRIGQDPELRYSQSQLPIVNLRIATNESYTDRDGVRQDKTEWHQVVAYDRTAENCARYLRKGSLVYVEGSLQTRKWQDKQGQDRYTTEIRAQRVKFLDRKGDNVGGYHEGDQPGRREMPQGIQPRREQQFGNRDAGQWATERHAAPEEFGAGGSEMDDVPFC